MTEPVGAREEGTPNADISVHRAYGIPHEGWAEVGRHSSWAHQDDWRLEDVAYGERWKQLAWGNRRKGDWRELSNSIQQLGGHVQRGGSKLSSVLTEAMATNCSLDGNIRR